MPVNRPDKPLDTAPRAVGEGFDGLVAIGGCDKNMPGCLIAMGRLNRPALMIYGDRDLIPKSQNLTEFVPNVDVINLDCGHCIQQAPS